MYIGIHSNNINKIIHVYVHKLNLKVQSTQFVKILHHIIQKLQIVFQAYGRVDPISHWDDFCDKISNYYACCGFCNKRAWVCSQFFFCIWSNAIGNFTHVDHIPSLLDLLLISHQEKYQVSVNASLGSIYYSLIWIIAPVMSLSRAPFVRSCRRVGTTGQRYGMTCSLFLCISCGDWV